MKLTAVAKKDIPQSSGYRTTKILEVLKEFAESDMEAARVDCHEYKNVTTAQASFHASIKRFGMKNITAIARSNQLYLIKEL